MTVLRIQGYIKSHTKLINEYDSILRPISQIIISISTKGKILFFFIMDISGSMNH